MNPSDPLPGPGVGPQFETFPRPTQATQPERPPPEPHADEDIARAAVDPVRLVDLVLAAPRRTGANVEQRRALGGIVAAFLLASVVFAIPYGCVLGWSAWWKVVVFYLGTTAICVPSLWVFSTYLGQKVNLAQILVLALSIPAVAAVFSFGFAPILGFMRWTMDDVSTRVSWHSLSNVLLGVAVAAGFAQLWRTSLSSKGMRESVLFPLVLMVWHAVFVFVLVRMGDVLDLGS